MAEQDIRTNIVATADFSNLIGNLNRVTSSLVKLQQQLAGSNRMLSGQIGQMNKSFAETLRSTGQFSTHFVSLTSDVEKFGTQLDKGQLKLNQYFKVWQDHSRTSAGLVRDLAKQQVQMQNAVLQPLGKNAQGLMQYNVHIPQGLDEIKNKTAIARQELQIMNKVMQQGAGQLINWGKNTQWAGRQLTVGLTVPMAAFGKAAADAFRQADEQLVRLTKVYGGLTATSSTELAKVRKDVAATATELSKSYGVSFKDTLGLAADIAATGKQGNELLGSIKETSRLSVLGEVDRQDAMKATLALQNAFKQNTTELAQSINFLNAVENQTSTTLNDLITAIPKAGPVIEGMGGSVKDLALYLTAMKEGGINATEGANALKSSIASLINPTKVAKEMFQGFGIDLSGIVTKNAGDLTSTILELQSALDTLNPLQKQQAIEQLFGKFQFARMNALFANLGKQGSQTLQVMDLMKASSQDLANVASRELSQVTESASGKYRRAVEGLKADLAKIGDQFLTINTHLINFVDGIIKFTQRLPDPIKKVLGFLGLLTAAAGPLIMLTGVLGNFFGYIIKGAYHLKSLFRGGEGWKLLTPEIMAANNAGSLIEKTFYSDAKAAAILKQAISNLSAELVILQQKANGGAISTLPAMQNATGMTVATPGGREVNPNHPLISPKDTRSMSHMTPRGVGQAETIFGVVPGAPRVNQKISNNPQMYMSGDLPKIPGLTSIGGVSTGVVSEEAAKWHSMTAAIAMQSDAELKLLKQEIAQTGTITASLSDSYQTLLPQMSLITKNAATETAAIVAELQASKITVDQARAKIIALNAQVEQMMVQTATSAATNMGRSLDVTKVPLVNQPVIDPSGKSNMKELTRPGRTRDLLNNIARKLGVKTFGAPYSIETTIPKRYNSGSLVPGTGNTDTVPAMLTPGEFVVNAKATQENLPLLNAINKGGAGGSVSSENKNYGPINPALMASVGKMFTRTGNFARRWFWDTSTGSSLSGQRDSLIRSIAKRPILNKNGVPYTEAELRKAPKSDIQALWANYDRGHVAPHRSISGTDNYFAPGILMPMFRGSNRSMISGGNPRLIAKGLEEQSIHPTVFLDEAAQVFGYPAGKNIDDAYSALIKALNKRGDIKFNAKSGDTFEKFAFDVISPYLKKVAKNNGSNLLDDLSRIGTLRGVQSNRSSTGSGTGSIGSFAIADDYFNLKMNSGGIVPGYAGGGQVLAPSIKKLIAKWGKVYGGNSLSNTDPLHGPLNIGRYRKPTAVRNIRQQAQIVYKGGYKPLKWNSGPMAGQTTMSPTRSSHVPAFLTGSLEDQGKYVTEEYMRGAYGVLNVPGAKEAMLAVRKKASGQFFRGINLNGNSNAGGFMRPLPEWLLANIKNAQATGDFSKLVGKEFIMRRSSWSSNPETAKGFGNFNISANVKNRKVTPASEMFPSLEFPTSSGPVKVNESESIFGGKFRIVGANKNGLEIETVTGPLSGKRENFGDVSAGGSYVVGENGPEVFVPETSGKITKPPLAAGFRSNLAYSKNRLGSLGSKARSVNFGSGAVANIGGTMAGMGIGGALGGQTGSMLGMMIGPAIVSQSAKLLTNMGGIKNALPVIKGLLGRLILPTGIVGGIAAVAQGLWVWKRHAEDVGKAHRAVFGPTKKSLEEVGLTYISVTDKLKKYREQTELARTAALASYNTTSKTGISALTLTIKQLEDGIKAAKTNAKETVQDFTKLTGRNEVVQLAESLKQQYVSAGMSVQEATNKIYTLIKASDKGAYAIDAITSSGFKSITDKATAAQYAINLVTKAISAGNVGTEEMARGIDNILNSLDSYRSSLIGTKDAQKNIITETTAQLMALDKISKIKAANNKLDEKTINTYKAQNLELGIMLNKNETLAGIYAKNALLQNEASLNMDLSGVSSKEAVVLAQGMEAYNAAVDKTVAKETGLSKIAEKLKEKSKANLKLSQGISTVNYDNIIKAQEKIIKGIDKELAARLKIIDAQKQQEDLVTSIKKEQIAYQEALASGDMAAAAIAQLNIQKLNRDSQDAAARQSIIDQAEKKKEAAQAIADRALANKDKKASGAKSAGTTGANQANQAAASLAGLSAISKIVKSIVPGTNLTTTTSSGRGLSYKETSTINTEGKTVLGKLDQTLNELKASGGPGAEFVNNFLKTHQTELSKIDFIKSLSQGAGQETSTGKFATAVDKFFNAVQIVIGEKPSSSKPISFAFPRQPNPTQVPKVTKAIGGYISGPGTMTSDSIPAMLSNGEYVINAKSVQAAGLPLLDKINKMAMGGLATRYNIPNNSLSVANSMPGYRNGGMVNHYSVGGIVVNGAPGQNVEDLATIVMGKIQNINTAQARKVGGNSRMGSGL